MDLDTDTELPEPGALRKLAHTTWHDHLVMLLHVAAEIEHGLMVQYLYAAYSLDPDKVDARQRAMVEDWRETLLIIAKEEMGHLLTVQNVLSLLGAPFNLGRDDFPWDAPYYPFPFTLEPVSETSLALYIYAEMPSADEAPDNDDLTPEELEDILAAVKRRAPRGAAHHVDVVYREIIDLLGDEERIPDAAFREDSFACQATWDDWGRRYKPAPRMLTAEGDLDRSAVKQGALPEPRVLILPVATRTQAVAAMEDVSEQGEGHLSPSDEEERSHFQRFLAVYRDYRAALAEDAGFAPARAVAVNPSTRDDAGPDKHYIENDDTRDWATLLNRRYRILLMFLGHSLRSAQGAAQGVGKGAPGLRAMLMHRVFGEMYNLKTISELLVQMPLQAQVGARGPELFAGPPFEMPYDLTLPHSEPDAWRMHLDLIEGAIELSEDLLSTAKGPAQDYLTTIIDLDRQTTSWIRQILAGFGRTERR
jgi:rubrerythrin